MPRARILFLGFVGLLVAGTAAYADSQPVVVVPGRPDVPVIINGADATGAVVSGDWGLYRPGAPVVVEGGIWPPAAVVPDWPPHYFPATGRTPAYGRKEIDPGPRRRGLSPEYHRSWTTESQPGPVTEYPPFAPPAVVVAPPDARRWAPPDIKHR
ncbi:MAG TPA: hypothetical protein VK456_06140 [Xanthobacteraceae bacterium]|nr:hypothetical protein [Xanthobacteraceae bacterium]